jgi:N-acetylmuramoyl-L-alanine amidase
MTQTRRFRTTSHRGSCSPSRAHALLSLCVLLGAMMAGAPALRAADELAARRAAAHEQFVHAEAQRAALEAKNERDQTLQNYKELVLAYRRVYLTTPNAADVPAALEEVGDLYRAMGERFNRSYFDSAVESYEFLLHEYPASRHCEEALLAIATVQRNGLAQANLAQKTYEDFVKRYPRSAHAEEARRSIAELKAEDTLSTPDTAPTSTAALETRSSPAKSASSEVGPIRVWNADTYTRIVIDLGGQAKYQAARIDDPDRIYFDIEGAKLNKELLRQTIEIPSGGYLKSIRAASNRTGVVRVVLEVTQVKDYSVFELSGPDRLVVDVFGPNAPANAAAPSVTANGKAAVSQPAPGARTSSEGGAAMLPASLNADAALTAKTSSEDARSHARTINTAGNSTTPPGVESERAVGSSAPPPSVKAKTAASDAAPASLSAKAEAAAIGPPAVPARNHSGDRSLTRALGLKINRIVIDAGHGGHDTGTIGPTGLMEKDLCLDLALRLGKLVQDRVPGAEVVYTREDDSFVPLEQRTGIANNTKADLFISIHANSSEDKRASGIETYYLNINASPEAMEVAARENALAQGSVHDLQDIVKKIARNEKIEESRDLATDIQESLATSIGRPEPNRGVRMAPFVVLIGADMPSVLAEISFLSNPADEQWLKKPESRQHIAEGLFHGMEAYLQSTNSLIQSATNSPSGARSTAVARSTDPQ